MDGATAALFGAGLATCGWVYSNRRNRLLSRKQHTINVIVQASLSSDFRNALDRIGLATRNGLCPRLELMTEPENEPLRGARKLVCNHLEFMAAGLRNGDFDERLVRDTQRSQFIETYNFFETQIKGLRDSRRRMTTYEHLEWLVMRWTERKPGGIQQVWEWLIQRPLPGKRVNG